MNFLCARCRIRVWRERKQNKNKKKEKGSKFPRLGVSFLFFLPLFPFGFGKLCFLPSLFLSLKKFNAALMKMTSMALTDNYPDSCPFVRFFFFLFLFTVYYIHYNTMLKKKNVFYFFNLMSIFLQNRTRCLVFIATATMYVL